jgi:hypothetical protein
MYQAEQKLEMLQTNLSGPASKHFSEPFCAFNECLGANDDTPYRCTNPLARQKLMLSKQSQYSFKLTPSPATASKSRAPSRCIAIGFWPGGNI